MNYLKTEDINQYLDKVIQSNVLPDIVKLLKCDRHESQFEASWVLTNVAAGLAHHTQAVVKAGAVQRLIQLMASPYLDVKEQVPILIFFFLEDKKIVDAWY